MHPERRPSDLTRAVRQLQLASHEATRAIARRLDLGTNDVTALQVIFAAEEPIGPVELGHRLGIRSASATALVDRLQESGHVRRTSHPQDRRRVVLETTPASWAGTLEALGPLLRAMDAVAEDLAPDEQEVVLRFLTGVTATLDAFANG
ncbi:MAG: MarR family winged helix-turn-helix transcriptional regulator [Propionibacteriaceae bacterium]